MSECRVAGVFGGDLSKRIEMDGWGARVYERLNERTNEIVVEIE